MTESQNYFIWKQKITADTKNMLLLAEEFEVQHKQCMLHPLLKKTIPTWSFCSCFRWINNRRSNWLLMHELLVIKSVLSKNVTVPRWCGTGWDSFLTPLARANEDLLRVLLEFDGIFFVEVFGFNIIHEKLKEFKWPPPMEVLGCSWRAGRDHVATPIEVFALNIKKGVKVQQDEVYQ